MSGAENATGCLGLCRQNRQKGSEWGEDYLFQERVKGQLDRVIRSSTRPPEIVLLIRETSSGSTLAVFSFLLSPLLSFPFLLFSFFFVSSIALSYYYTYAHSIISLFVFPPSRLFRSVFTFCLIFWDMFYQSIVCRCLYCVCRSSRSVNQSKSFDQLTD